MKKISNNPKFRIPNSAFLIFLVLVNLLGLFSLTASAAEGDVASVTVGETTTNYTSLDDALHEAQNNPGSTLTLLQDIDRGSEELMIRSVPDSTFTIDLNGCTLTSTTATGTVFIQTRVNLTVVDSKGTGGIISNNNAFYIDWNGTTVNIKGVTITVTSTFDYDSGVFINNSNATVNIIDSTILSERVGVYGGGTLNISGDTRITATSSNMAAIHRTGGALTITGGSITGGVYVDGGTADIIGGTITEPRDYYNAVDVVNNAQVTISGGSISGVNADLCNVSYNPGTIKLTLDEGKTVGATFPGGITVEGNTLAELLATDTAAYWGVVDGKDTMLTVADDAATGITDNGDITIRAICDHSGNTNDYTDNNDGTHDATCTDCGAMVVDNESHTGGTATCAEKAKCQHCGASYGEVDTTNHDSSVAFDSNGFCPNGCYQPAELKDGYYEIKNAGNLYWFAQQVNGGNGAINGKLTTNIVVNKNVLVDGALNSNTEGFRVWTPIGYWNSSEDLSYYIGTFDGAGFTVSGLYHNDSTKSSIGLFGAVSTNGIVKDVGVVDSYFCGKEEVGGVVGYIYEGTVQNCYNTGIVSGNTDVGGVVGYNTEGTVQNCYNMGTVRSDGTTGGVVGMYWSGSVANCHNTSTVNGGNETGGVVGYMISGNIEHCYNTGAVNGSKQTGGILGCSQGGNVKNCYNTGTVSGSNQVGGVVGYIDSGTVENCYNANSVSGSSSVGGVVGKRRDSQTGITTNSYFDSTKYSGSAIGGNDAGTTTVEGKTTEQFASGKVAYLLGNAFGQTLGENGDAHPVFVTDTNHVYRYTKCDGTTVAFTNDSSLADKVAPHISGENATCTDNKDGTHSLTCTICEEPVTAAHDFDSNELECGVCHASAVSIHGQQLNIGSDLSMKYYIEVFNSALDVEKLKMIFTINDAVIEVDVDEPNAEGFYVFTLNGINPQCMGDNIYAKLFYDGVEVANHGYDEKYSVEINLGNLLKKYPDDEALVALIKDTLAYGKAAEEYIGHTSIEGDYTGTDREIPVSELTMSPEGDLRVHQATVRFGTMNHIVLMIESKNGAPTVKVGEQSVDVTLYAENSSYYVSVLHGVCATDFDKDITVCISDGTTTVDYTVSINDYLYAISQSSTDEKMVNLAKALYNYGVSAKIYNHVKTDVVEHIGGEATCISGKICDICKTVYSEVDSTNHASDKYIYTDNGNGTHTKKHACCGATAGEPEDHIYEYTYNSNDTHSFTCTVCDISGNEDHAFTDEVCTVCGLIDATEMTAESLNTTVMKVLTEGKTDITVSLAADAPAEMFTAIRRALIDTEGVKDGSINLTIAGVTAIPNHSDSPSDYSLIFGNVGHNENGNMLDTHEVVTQLASVNLPDATSIGDDAFKECENLTVLIAPKVQTIGQYAFAHTNLTSIDLPEATTLKAGAFLNCSNITEFNLPKVTVLGYVALDIDYWTLNTYDSERTIYLTTSDEIKVDTGCFYELVDAGLLETHVNLVLNSNKQSEVSGNTWTTKDANGNTVSFTFKSITIEG